MSVCRGRPPQRGWGPCRLGAQHAQGVCPDQRVVCPSGDPWPESPAHQASAAFLGAATEGCGTEGGEFRTQIENPTWGLPPPGQRERPQLRCTSLSEHQGGPQGGAHRVGGLAAPWETQHGLRGAVEFPLPPPNPHPGHTAPNEGAPNTQ